MPTVTLFYRAHRLVLRAVQRKELVPPRTCEACGQSNRRNPLAHHDDYAKPLDVRWLCRDCHIAWHAEHGPGANRHETIEVEAYQRPVVTHCPQGHPYDEENTRHYAGSRHCRTCARIQGRERQKAWRAQRLRKLP